MNWGQAKDARMELKDRSRGLEYLEVLLRYFANNAGHVPVEKLRETADEFFEQGRNFFAWHLILPTFAFLRILRG